MLRELSPFNDNWNSKALLTCAQMRRAEALSCARGTHDYWDLMKVAGGAVAKAAMERFKPCRVLVLCGAGNNGGDGYVAAEALRLAGWDVRVGALAVPTAKEAIMASQAWQGETVPLSPTLLEDCDLVIDALFGTGLTRPLEDTAAQMIEAVAAKGIPVIAADIPSGVDGDTGRVLGCAARAVATVTFFRKKVGHALLPALDLCGEVIVADTGMYADVLDEISPTIAENNSALWRASQPKLEVQNNKFHRGHALIFGGPIMTGASRLAARAAQRMGAGLVTLGCPPEAWEIYAKSLESVMVRPLRSGQDEAELLGNPKVTAILIGPGLGREVEAKDQILRVLPTGKQAILDADALSLFEGDERTLLNNLHEKCILTPHEGEHSRVFGVLDADKITKARNSAQKAGCIVLLKGADTVIAHPEGFCVVNTNAPPWLATAGAGDVLAGMILGLVTAGMPLFAAACAAAHEHGQAATLCGQGLIAEDLVDRLSTVIQTRL